MMAYKLQRFTGVIRLADGSFIPDDPRNCDWQQYLDWVAKGGTAQAEAGRRHRRTNWTPPPRANTPSSSPCAA
jgi:hypothetical protein